MSTPQNVAIGQMVMQARKKAGISREKLCKKLQVEITQQMLAKYENGTARWPADLVCDVSAILSIDIRALLNVPVREGK